MAFIPKTTTNLPHHHTGNRKQLQKPLHRLCSTTGKAPKHRTVYEQSIYTGYTTPEQRIYSTYRNTTPLFFSTSSFLFTNHLIQTVFAIFHRKTPTAVNAQNCPFDPFQGKPWKVLESFCPF